MDLQFIEPVIRLPFVEAIYIFGAYARGDATEKSDLELAIICPSASVADWLRIIEFMDSSGSKCRINSMRYDRLQDGPIKMQIDRYKKLLYEKPGREGKNEGE